MMLQINFHDISKKKKKKRRDNWCNWTLNNHSLITCIGLHIVVCLRGLRVLVKSLKRLQCFSIGLLLFNFTNIQTIVFMTIFELS